MSNYSLSKISKELNELERKKKEVILKTFNSTLIDLEKLLNIEMVKDESNKNYERYSGVYQGKEIRISGEKYNKVKKILIFDISTLNVIYTGIFNGEAEHYVSILKAYNKKPKSQTGYYKKY